MAFLRRFFQPPPSIIEQDLLRAQRLLRWLLWIAIITCLTISLANYLIGNLNSFWLLWAGIFVLGSLVLLIVLRPVIVYGISRLFVFQSMLLAAAAHFIAGEPFPHVAAIGLIGIVSAGSLFSRRYTALVSIFHIGMGIIAFGYWWPRMDSVSARGYLITNAVAYFAVALAAAVFTLVIINAFRISWLEAREAQHLLGQRNRESEQLLAVAYSLRSTTDLNTLLQLIMDKLKEVLPYHAGILAQRIDEGGFQIVGGDQHLKGNATLQRALRPTSPPNPLEQRLIDEHKTILDNALVPGAEMSRIHVPLIHQNETIGFLSLSKEQPYKAEEVTLIEQFAQYAAVAIANARAYEQSLQAATLSERSRLARELHDSVSQALFGIVLGSRTLSQVVDGNTAAQEATNYVLNLSEVALAEMRALIFELHPESLQKEGLRAALQKQITALCARHNLKLNMNLDSAEPDMPLRAKEALYRISLEALQNTIKHARASQIDLTLREEPHRVWLEIKDNGHGFDPQRQYSGHLGMVSMRERAAEAGATLHVTSAPNQGTAIRVDVPR